MKCNLIYIFGVERRSGTNYLANLFLKHPQIVYCDQPGEDHLLTASESLLNYIENVEKKWSKSWKGMDKSLYKEKLTVVLGESLNRYLGFYEDKTILTKTPSTVGIDNFFTFFPGGKAVILVRDGRNVVESGVQSFGWNYENGFKWWNESCLRVESFLKAHEKMRKNVFLVKYEDLNDNPVGWMERIFDHFEISVKGYPFDEIENIPIIGSSTSLIARGKVDWSIEVKKNDGFNPNERFLSWGSELKSSYNRICGDMAIRFGYDVFAEPKGLLRRILRR